MRVISIFRGGRLYCELMYRADDALVAMREPGATWRRVVNGRLV